MIYAIVTSPTDFFAFHYISLIDATLPFSFVFGHAIFIAARARFCYDIVVSSPAFLPYSFRRCGARAPPIRHLCRVSPTLSFAQRCHHADRRHDIFALLPSRHFRRHSSHYALRRPPLPPPLSPGSPFSCAPLRLHRLSIDFSAASCKRFCRRQFIVITLRYRLAIRFSRRFPLPDADFTPSPLYAKARRCRHFPHFSFAPLLFVSFLPAAHALCRPSFLRAMTPSLPAPPSSMATCACFHLIFIFFRQLFTLHIMPHFATPMPRYFCHA